MVRNLLTENGFTGIMYLYRVTNKGKKMVTKSQYEATVRFHEKAAKAYELFGKTKDAKVVR